MFALNTILKDFCIEYKFDSVAMNCMLTVFCFEHNVDSVCIEQYVGFFFCIEPYLQIKFIFLFLDQNICCRY